ncbi:uncharacterized protein N7503_003509 [Penicillium pulvis]|uniref:uncharacterized protein n=1 Tax=Penicillium pulvis TaxID=1562058 RepID=UPI002546ACA2|nr:uncharacterized protein N7503_003509 [Penicillium pulvis]KAJ5805907.1 hypothetical protein N7503_003509 [Penicillium pulvis]
MNRAAETPVPTNGFAPRAIIKRTIIKRTIIKRNIVKRTIIKRTIVKSAVVKSAIAKTAIVKCSGQTSTAVESLLAYMPVTNLQALHIQGKERQSYIATSPSLTSIPTESLLNATSEITVLPFVLNNLEQNLILRYLRSRCHSWNRLHTEGYILGSGYISENINNNKRAHKTSIRLRDFRDIPRTILSVAGKVSAIAIDCEMVGVRGGRQTLAFLTAINFLTGEVLINRYVSPIEDVIDWRSKFSGVTPTIMASAVASGAAFGSWREARDKLWEFMDESTVLVGQSLNYDLEVLGMTHAKVVDSAILTSEAVFPSVTSTTPLPRQWGLKRLAKDLLSLDIQNSNCGHSALEDTYAARDVVIWCIMNPEELKIWAENAGRQEEERKLAQKRQKKGKKGAKGKSPANQGTRYWETNSSREDYTEYLQWSDLAEDLGWPEGYDPWSD